MPRTMGAKDKKPRKTKVYGVWFEGRRTAIVRSADSRGQAISIARKAKRRGGDRVVSARPLKGSSLKAAQAGRWTRERARPGDDSNLRGFGPRPKGFAARSGSQLATFGRPLGARDRRPRKRRGLLAGLGATALSGAVLAPLGATVATMKRRSDRRVDRTINKLTKTSVPPAFLDDLADNPETLKVARMQQRVSRAAGGNANAEEIYNQVMREGKSTPEQVKQLKRLARKDSRLASKALKKNLMKRFYSRKALIGAGVGAGLALGAGALYGAGKKRNRSYDYDYYDDYDY